jgi:hypothetical protein
MGCISSILFLFLLFFMQARIRVPDRRRNKQLDLQQTGDSTIYQEPTIGSAAAASLKWAVCCHNVAANGVIRMYKV